MGKFSKLAFWRKSKNDVTPIETGVVESANSKDLVEAAAPPAPQASQQVLETPAAASLPTLLGTPRKPSSPARESPAALAAPEAPREVPSPAVEESSVAVAAAPISPAMRHAVPVGPLPPIGEDASGGDLAQRRVSLNSSLRKKDGTPRKPVSFDAKIAFDVPPEQLWQEASEVLGARVAESLQSSKWDKRVQALKTAAAALKGPVPGRDLKKLERVKCWRSLCQVLNQLMRDKVMPVRLEAHAAFVAAFTNVTGIDHDEVQYALSTLLEHLLDRLGDSNLRLHESARKCVLFTAEQQGLLGLGPVLERLKAHLVAAGTSPDRVKVHFGILDTVDFLLQHFPGHRSEDGEDGEDEDDDDDTPADTWTQRDVSPFIVAGMCDSLGQRVRTSAVKLAVTVYSTFGLDAMQPMLVGLRPAKQQLLKQKFEESELDDHDKAEAAAVTEGGKMAARGASPTCGSREAGQPVSGPKAAKGGSKASKASKAARAQAGHAEPHPAAGGSKHSSPLPAKGLAAHAAFDEEDLLMDHILEDVGMVFGGNDSCAPGCAMLPGMMDPLLNLEELEEQCFLEQQLRELGLTVDAKRANGSGRVGALPSAMPPLSGPLPIRIEGYGKGSKVPAVARMRASPIAIC